MEWKSASVGVWNTEKGGYFGQVWTPIVNLQANWTIQGFNERGALRTIRSGTAKDRQAAKLEVERELEALCR